MRAYTGGGPDLIWYGAAGTFTAKGRTFGRNDTISLDGTTGEVIAGALGTVAPTMSGDFAKLMRWADKHRVLGVRTNADTPADAQRALEAQHRQQGIADALDPRTGEQLRLA